MKDNLSIVITMLVFVVLIVIFPLYNYFERQDDMSYNLALKETTAFVDEVLNSGYVDQQMYDDFVDKLAATGNIYDIQLEGHEKVKVKEDEDGNTYNEQYLISYNDDIFSSIDSNNSADTSDITKKNIINGAYFLNEGDQFYVKLKNANTTMAGAIFNTIVPTSKKDRIVVNYGGIVKNTSWNQVRQEYNNVKYSYMVNVEFYLNGDPVDNIFRIDEENGEFQVNKYYFGPYMKNSDITLKLGDYGEIYNAEAGVFGRNTIIYGIKNIYIVDKIELNGQEINESSEYFVVSEGKINIKNIVSDQTLKICLQTGQYMVSFTTSHSMYGPMNTMDEYYHAIGEDYDITYDVKYWNNVSFDIGPIVNRGYTYKTDYGVISNFQVEAIEEFTRTTLSGKEEKFKFIGWYKYTGNGKSYREPDNYTELYTKDTNLNVYAFSDDAYMAKYKELTEDYKFVVYSNNSNISIVNEKIKDENFSLMRVTVDEGKTLSFDLKCFAENQDGYLIEKTLGDLSSESGKKYLYVKFYQSLDDFEKYEGSSYISVDKIDDTETIKKDIINITQNTITFKTIKAKKNIKNYIAGVRLAEDYENGTFKSVINIPVIYFVKNITNAPGKSYFFNILKGESWAGKDLIINGKELFNFLSIYKDKIITYNKNYTIQHKFIVGEKDISVNNLNCEDEIFREDYIYTVSNDTSNNRETLKFRRETLKFREVE